MHCSARAQVNVALAIVIGIACSAVFAQASAASAEQVKRGEYLVGFGGCHDCHSPKTMTSNGPVPDGTRLLSGHRSDAKLAQLPAGVLGPGQWGAIANQVPQPIPPLK